MLRTKEKVPVVSNTPAVKVYEYFTKHDNNSINLSVVELNGEYGTNLNRVCCLIYYMLKGKMELVLGTEKYDLKKDDSVMIPPNSPYKIKGKASFIIASAPAWYFEQYEENIK